MSVNFMLIVAGDIKDFMSSTDSLMETAVQTTDLLYSAELLENKTQVQHTPAASYRQQKQPWDRSGEVPIRGSNVIKLLSWRELTLE